MVSLRTAVLALVALVALAGGIILVAEERSASAAVIGVPGFSASELACDGKALIVKWGELLSLDVGSQVHRVGVLSIKKEPAAAILHIDGRISGQIGLGQALSLGEDATGDAMLILTGISGDEVSLCVVPV